MAKVLPDEFYDEESKIISKYYDDYYKIEDMLIRKEITQEEFHKRNESLVNDRDWAVTQLKISYNNRKT